MKRILLATLLISIQSLAFAQISATAGAPATWYVTAGGTPDANTPDPFFDPQNLVIAVGDIVIWQNLQGWHNISTTSGPDDFSYGPAGSDWTHEYTFTMAGNYSYECGVGDHALTQFGTVVVEALTTIDENSLSTLQINPNPASSVLEFNLDSFISGKVSLKLMNILGEVVWARQDINDVILKLDVTSFERGLYIVVLQNGSDILSQKVLLN